MNHLISESKPKARKDHCCMSSQFISNCSLREYTFTFSEWRAIIKARNNRWMIQKGDVYIKQAINDNGSIYTFKAIPEIHDICIKYDYYELS